MIVSFLKEEIIEEGFIKELSSQISNIQLIKFSLNKSRLLTHNLSLNLTDRTKASDDTERTLDDTVRVKMYENDVNSDKHEYKIYAKEAAGNNYLKDGKTLTRREFVGYNYIGGIESDDHPLAETFETPSIICKYSVGGFMKNDIKRYTIVIWLEGEDPQSNDTDEAPEDAKLKLGVDIKAYENVAEK